MMIGYTTTLLLFYMAAQRCPKGQQMKHVMLLIYFNYNTLIYLVELVHHIHMQLNHYEIKVPLTFSGDS